MPTMVAFAQLPTPSLAEPVRVLATLVCLTPSLASPVRVLATLVCHGSADARRAMRDLSSKAATYPHPYERTHSHPHEGRRHPTA